MKIVIATNNKLKIKEIKEILNEGYELLTLEEAGINYDVEETGLTFEFNANKKAVEYYNLCKIPVIAEDSGLCIPIFNGLPGVFSKRLYLNKPENGNKIILDNLKDVPDKLRSAYFTAYYSFYDGNKIINSHGEMHGVIMHDIQGDNGFAYDKIFFSTELNKRLSEVSQNEKNTFSHRRKGLTILQEKIANYYAKKEA